MRRTRLVLMGILVLVGVLLLNPVARGSRACLVANGRVDKLILGGVNRVPPSHSAPLWKMELVHLESQKTISITSNEEDSSGFHVQSSTLNRPEATTAVRYTIVKKEEEDAFAVLDTWTEKADNQILFYSALDELNNDYTVKRLWYPIIPLKPLGSCASDDHLVLPEAHGQLIESIRTAPMKQWGRGPDQIRALARCHYPSKQGNLQMLFYHDSEGGLLLMTPDPERRIKDILIDRREDAVRACFIHYLTPRTPVTSRVEQPYPVRLQWIDGDWYDAAQVYRKWAMKQAWSAKMLADREDVPEWFKGLPGWVRIPWDPGVEWEDKTKWPLMWAEAVGTPLGVHWYGWSPKASNRLYPLWDPPREDMSKKVKLFHERGIFAMPYLNARIVCTENKGWQEFKTEVVRNPDRSIRSGESWPDYVSKAEYLAAKQAGRRVNSFGTEPTRWQVYHDFAVACAPSELWQDNVYERTLRLLRDYGVDAVYHDQVGNWPMLCFDATHGHPPADPLAWQRGREELYKRIASAEARHGLNGVLVSEYLGEALLPFFQGGLTVSGPELYEHRAIPLFAAVYHTHMVAIGWDQGGLHEGHAKCVHRLMMPFVYGAQIGWLHYQIPQLVEDYPQIVKCYKEASELRRRFPQMLGWGKMLRPPHVDNVAERMVSSRYGDASYPAIVSGFFREGSEGDSALAVFANWTSKAQTGVAHLDVSELPSPVEARGVGGESLRQVSDDYLKVPLELGPFSVKAVLVTAD